MVSVYRNKGYQACMYSMELLAQKTGTTTETGGSAASLNVSVLTF